MRVNLPREYRDRLDEVLLSSSVEHQLRNECETLYRVLFSRVPPSTLAPKYEKALAAWGVHTPLPNPYATFLERGICLEGIELVLRRRNSQNPLSQRFHLLLYLVEGEQSDEFINYRPSFLRGSTLLIGAALRSAFLWFLGVVTLLFFHRGHRAL